MSARPLVSPVRRFRCWAALIAAAVSVLLVAPGAHAATMTLASVTVDKSALLGPDTDWNPVPDGGGTVVWTTETWTGTYQFTVPTSIPAGGVSFTMTVKGESRKNGFGHDTRFAPAMSARSDIVTPNGQVGVNALSDSATQPSDEKSAPVTLTPRVGTGVLLVSIQDGPTYTYTFQGTTDPPPPPPPPATPGCAITSSSSAAAAHLERRSPSAKASQVPTTCTTPRSVLPRVGVMTSYAAPRPGGTAGYGLPVLGGSVRAATGDIALVRGNGPGIDDPGFIVAVEPSDENVGRAVKLCVILALQDPGMDLGDDLVTGDRARGGFARCTSVVARILQRAEELRRRRDQPLSARAAQAGRCRSATVRRRGSRARSPVVVTCVRTTPVGMRITIRSRSRSRSLRSAVGRAPKLIIGRSRLTDAQRGDRLNVLWRTSTRR